MKTKSNVLNAFTDMASFPKIRKVKCGTTIIQLQIAGLLNEDYGRAASVWRAESAFHATEIWPVTWHVFSDHEFVPSDSLTVEKNVSMPRDDPSSEESSFGDYTRKRTTCLVTGASFVLLSMLTSHREGKGGDIVHDFTLPPYIVGLGPIPAFAWSDFGKPWKTEMRMAGPGIEFRSSRMQDHTNYLEKHPQKSRTPINKCRNNDWMIAARCCEARHTNTNLTAMQTHRTRQSHCELTALLQIIRVHSSYRIIRWYSPRSFYSRTDATGPTAHMADHAEMFTELPALQGEHCPSPVSVAIRIPAGPRTRPIRVIATTAGPSPSVNISRIGSSARPSRALVLGHAMTRGTRP
ncbi:hypothetical protein PR048_013461, partial [Dryococelus australis]